MKCGGTCAQCRGRFDHNRAIELGNRVLAQLDSSVTRFAKHPAEEERAHANRVPLPDPASHSVPPARRAPSTSVGPPSSGTPRNPCRGSLGTTSKRSLTPNKQPKTGMDESSQGTASGSGSGGVPPPPPPEPPPDRSPRGPPLGPPKRSANGDGPPSRPSHVPDRSADLDWRDRAIRAEALLDRLQADHQELRGGVSTLEATKEKREQDNKVLYGQACVAEQWDQWFQQQQQQAGFLSGYYRTPRSTPRGTPRGTPHSSVGAESRNPRSTRKRSQSVGKSDEGYISRSSTPARSRSVDWKDATLARRARGAPLLAVLAEGAPSHSVPVSRTDSTR